MSFIPAKCPQCSGTLMRINNMDPNVVCVDCKREFELLEITMNNVNSSMGDGQQSKENEVRV